MLLIKNPIAQFFTLDGDPLDNGSVYIGIPGLNPETNPVAIYWDRDGLVPAINPAKTSRGFVENNGSPARLYIDNLDYSVTVKDSKGLIVYSSLSVTAETIGALAGTTGAANIGFDNTASGLTATNVQDAIDELAATPAVAKAGDTMTGPLNVPSGAAGTQVPQAQEVIGRTSSTGSAKLPYGTSAQRDGSPSNGFARVNSDFDALEHLGPNGWKQYGIVSSAVFDANTGTSHEIANIPTWAKRVTLHLNEVSTNGSGNVLVQVGTSTALQTSGYDAAYLATSASSTTIANITNGLPLYRVSASDALTGSIEFVRQPATGNWKMVGITKRSSAGALVVSVGTVTLTDDLTRVAIVRTASESFDASGKIWATWEG